MRGSVLIGLSVMLATSPAMAQSRISRGTTPAADGQEEDQQDIQQQQQQTPLQTNPSGRTARSSVGQVGERQTQDSAARQAGIEPMARIASRVQNRVQNRIRNRIDRYYDPRATATDPFIVAGNQARRGSRPR